MFAWTMLFGAVVGFSLGLTGGGGAIFAVPLLVYGIGIDPREAVGVSLVAVGTTALAGFLQRWHVGLVEVRTGLIFAVAGMATAPVGAWIAQSVPEALLLPTFALLMLVVALRMWRRAADPAERLSVVDASREPGGACRRDPEGALRLTSRCAMLLAGVGMGAGVLTGLFGVGGGFIIVPALVTFSEMDIHRAVGTSLLVIALMSVSGVAAVVVLGRPLPIGIVGWFVAGSLGGLLAGGALARRLGGPRLQKVFAAAIVVVAAFVIGRQVIPGS